MNAYIATFVISTIPNFILFLVPDSIIQSLNGSQLLLCFAAGALLGDVFLHTLPHLLAHEDHEHNHEPATIGEHDEQDPHTRGLTIGCTVMLGFLIFMLSERLITIFIGSSHDHDAAHDHKNDDDDDDKKKQHKHPIIGAAGWLNIAADAMHNFTDGIALGVSYRGGKSLGFATLLSVFFHEIPHEFADFSILVTSGMTKFQAIRMQFITAIAAMLGTWLGNMLTENNKFMEDMLIAGTSGGFVYIATISALATVLTAKRKVTLSQSILEVLMVTLGVAMMLAVAMSEEHEEHHEQHHHHNEHLEHAHTAHHHHDHGHVHHHD